MSSGNWRTVDINVYDILVLCMRTTLYIDDHPFAEIKGIAAEAGKTPAAVIQGALRESLSRRHVTASRNEKQTAMTPTFSFCPLPSNFLFQTSPSEA